MGLNRAQEDMPDGAERPGPGTRTLRDVTELPETPDLAVICTPPDVVPGLIDYLGSRGTRAVVVITAGFGEGGDAHGEGLKRAMQDAARHPA